MAGRVAVLSPDGQFGTVDAADAEAVKLAGGKVLSAAETKAREEQTAQQAKYDAQSTAEKVAVHASMLGPLGYPLHAALRARGVVAAPEVEAYTQGVSQGFTGGMASVGMQKAIETLGDKEAAKAYGETARVTSEMHSGLHTAGEVAGFLGGASAGPVGRVGGAVEGAVARGTAGLAARGVGGRAASAALNLGARGAAEGAILGGAQQYSADVLGDREVAGDKVFAAMGLGALTGGAGGALIGGAGSLAMSGARAAGSGLVRSLARGEEAVAGAAKAGAEAAEGAATKADGPLARFFGTKTDEPLREIAQDRAFRSAGLRKAYVTEINARVPGGTKSMGEMMMREGIISAEEGLVNGVINGTPEAMLPKAAAALERVGGRIGELTSASPGTISAGQVADAVHALAKEYGRNAATKPAADSLRRFARTMGETLGEGMDPLTIPAGASEDVVRGLVRDQKIPVQRLLEERRALSNLVFEGPASINPSLDKEIKQKLARKLEDLITQSMDDASGKVAGEFASEYKTLKSDYQRLRILNDGLEDSVNRGTANRTFSLTDKMIGSAAGGAGSLIGGPLGGLVAGPGAAAISKVVRERGDAAVALLLSKAADMASLTKTVKAVDDQIGRAASGMLQPAKAATKALPAGPTPTEPVRARAEKTMEALATLQANPQRIMDAVTQQTRPMLDTAPDLAGVVQTRAVQALAFIASKAPTRTDHDPLDPHPPARMSDVEAASFMRTVEYASRPVKFFEDLERGKLTFEGAEAARALMPGAFAELQSRVLDQLADLRTRGVRPPYQQRQYLGAILDIPATPSQRPDHMAFLQGNVQQPAKMQPAPPKRPLPTKSSKSSLDRLEGK